MVGVKNKSSNYDVKRSRKIEKWSDVISQLNIDISKSINYITAKQIKQITDEDARLMAKIDKIEHLPRIFKEHNLFLLPVSRKEYALVRGAGYHQLEAVTDIKPVSYTTRLPIAASSWKRESEVALLENANSSGLLREVTGVSDLIRMPIGRTTTPEFSFYVDSTQITVDRAHFDSANGNMYVTVPGDNTVSVISTISQQPPKTTNTSAVDGNNAPVQNGGSTSSNSITFTFTTTGGVPPYKYACSDRLISVAIHIFGCSPPDASPL